jgi:hypothetical protein
MPNQLPNHQITQLPNASIYSTHSGGGVIIGWGVLPGSGRPEPSSRLMARTVMS